MCHFILFVVSFVFFSVVSILICNFSRLLLLLSAFLVLTFLVFSHPMFWIFLVVIFVSWCSFPSLLLSCIFSFRVLFMFYLIIVHFFPFWQAFLTLSCFLIYHTFLFVVFFIFKTWRSSCLPSLHFLFCLFFFSYFFLLCILFLLFFFLPFSYFLMHCILLCSCMCYFRI